jgi:hypothetical protein
MEQLGFREFFPADHDRGARTAFRVAYMAGAGAVDEGMDSVVRVSPAAAGPARLSRV